MSEVSLRPSIHSFPDSAVSGPDSSLNLAQSATALIIAGFVRNNHVAPAALPSLVSVVMTTLTDVGGGRPLVADAPPTPPVPAIDPRRSVGKDHITCLTCGVNLKILRRHIKTSHGMTPHAYRMFWGLPPEYPMICKSYSVVRSTLARKIRLGHR